jgi:hypothetical protein
VIWRNPRAKRRAGTRRDPLRNGVRRQYVLAGRLVRVGGFQADSQSPDVRASVRTAPARDPGYGGISSSSACCPRGASAVGAGRRHGRAPHAEHSRRDGERRDAAGGAPEQQTERDGRHDREYEGIRIHRVARVDEQRQQRPDDECERQGDERPGEPHRSRRKVLRSTSLRRSATRAETACGPARARRPGRRPCSSQYSRSTSDVVLGLRLPAAASVDQELVTRHQRQRTRRVCPPSTRPAPRRGARGAPVRRAAHVVEPEPVANSTDLGSRRARRRCRA